MKDGGGRTPLHVAVENGNRHVVEYLLEEGYSTTLSMSALDGTTPIRSAIRLVSVVVNFLLTLVLSLSVIVIISHFELSLDKFLPEIREMSILSTLCVVTVPIH